MLGKLLKYELKSTSRILGVLYIAVMIVAAVVGFAAGGIIWQATQGNEIAFVVGSLIYVLLIMVLMIVTVILVIERFYKNLLREEGYLMHTLPVPTWMLVASKVISALIWIVLSIVAVVLSLLILGFTSMISSGILMSSVIDWSNLPWGEMHFLFQQNAGEVILTILAAILQIVRLVLLVYTAMAIGAAAKQHKVLYSVISFVIILIIIGIIGMFTFQGLFNQAYTMDDSSINYALNLSDQLFPVYTKTLLLQILSDGIYSVVFFLVTTWFLKNKLNLE